MLQFLSYSTYYSVNNLAIFFCQVFECALKVLMEQLF